jgi:uncharacterized protein YndB with AHSA1/START domain
LANDLPNAGRLGTYHQDVEEPGTATHQNCGNRAGRSGVGPATTEGTQLPDFTITRQIDAPVESVWAVLQDFGDIQRWSPGVTDSNLTSEGPVREGSTRHCSFAPFGGVDERIARYEPNARLTVDIYETFKLPISGAVADFNIAPNDGGTQLTLVYSYTLNRFGRVAKSYTDKQMRKGIGGMAKGLQRESERIATSR